MIVRIIKKKVLITVIVRMMIAITQMKPLEKAYRFDHVIVLSFIL
jgi:hypothetical protein